MKRISYKGFTLVEMLLYIALSSSILLITVVFLAALLDVSVSNQVKSEINQQGAVAITVLSQTIRNAKGIVTPAPGATSSSISIATIKASTSPTIFDVATGTLRMKEGSSSPILLTSSRVIVSGLIFSNTSASSTDGGSVEFSFVLSNVSSSTRKEYQASSSFTGFAPFH